MILIARQKLARLMLIKGVSQRDVAEAAGWRSHSYLGRLIRGDVASLDNDAAVRIAHYLEVPIDVLFMSRSSSDSARSVQSKKSA